MELTEDSILDELNHKIECIENEMDIRIESLIDNLHKYREEYKNKLVIFKEKLKKYFCFICLHLLQPKQTKKKCQINAKIMILYSCSFSEIGSVV